MAHTDLKAGSGETLDAKLALLKSRLEALKSVAVAFSGGVDSTLLLKVAHDTLGNSAFAITAKAPMVPAREIEETRAFCEAEGIRHVIVEPNVFDIEGFANNPPDRCYLCKREILSCLFEAARANGALAVVEGSNLDDDADFRPGSKAVAELGAASPLKEAGLDKDSVRALARRFGLKVWDKPAYACLATRFPYGERLTEEKLSKVEHAEYALHDEGFIQARVRMKGDAARIEVPPADIARLAAPDVRGRITEKLHGLGFTFVSADLDGYRKGSMNETL